MVKLNETRSYTSGAKLKTMLGLGNYYVAYTRILYLPLPMMIVYYDTVHPNSPITEGLVMQSRIPVNVFRLPGNSSLYHTPVANLEDYNGNLDGNMCLVTVDLGGILGYKSKQVKSIKPWVGENK